MGHPLGVVGKDTGSPVLRLRGTQSYCRLSTWGVGSPQSTQLKACPSDTRPWAPRLSTDARWARLCCDPEPHELVNRWYGEL